MITDNILYYFNNSIKATILQQQWKYALICSFNTVNILTDL